MTDDEKKKEWRQYRFNDINGHRAEYYDREGNIKCISDLDDKGNAVADFYIEESYPRVDGYRYLKGSYSNPERPEDVYLERYFYDNGTTPREEIFKDKDGDVSRIVRYYPNGKIKETSDNKGENIRYNEKGVCIYHRRKLREDEKTIDFQKNDYYRETYYDNNGNKTMTVRRTKNGKVMRKTSYYPNGNTKEVEQFYPNKGNIITTYHKTFYENGNVKSYEDKNFNVTFYDNGQIKEIISSGKCTTLSGKDFQLDKQYDYSKIRHQEFDRDGNLIKEERMETGTYLSLNQEEKTQPTRTIQERISYLREERAKLNADTASQDRLCSYQEYRQQETAEDNNFIMLWMAQHQKQA